MSRINIWGVNEMRCQAKIFERSGFRTYPCGRQAKYRENDTDYCGIHAPSKIAERKEKRRIREGAEKEALHSDPVYIASRLEEYRKKLAWIQTQIDHWTAKLAEVEAEEVS